MSFPLKGGGATYIDNKTYTYKSAVGFVEDKNISQQVKGFDVYSRYLRHKI